MTYSGTTDVAPSDPMRIGAAVPYAAIVVSAGVATLKVTSIQVAGANLIEEGYPSTTVTFPTPSVGPAYLDFYQSGGEGAAFVLGQDPDPKNITLGMAYRRAMSNGARYQGMLSIICRS
ncbi:MAG: hypothetical protein IPN06_14470 [Burkholderiales bacterium]|nr:hypothetical protein [Burkholderiales bacterium]